MKLDGEQEDDSEEEDDGEILDDFVAYIKVDGAITYKPCDGNVWRGERMFLQRSVGIC